MKFLRLHAYVFALSLIAMIMFAPLLSGADPLDNWHVRNSPTTNTLRAVTYGNGTFVAVGDNGTILTSLDGLSWAMSISGTSAAITGATHGEGKFVAVAIEGTILTSDDGNSWIATASNSSPLAVTYGNGVFAAVGHFFTVVTSPDDITWTVVPIGIANPLYGITYGEGTFVAVGGAEAVFSVGTPSWVATSLDGMNWVLRGAAISEPLSVIYDAVAFGDSNFVAVGHSDHPSFRSRIISSSDGINWSMRASGIGATLRGVGFGGDIFITVGDSGTILTSTDVTNWVDRKSGVLSSLRSVAFGNGTFVAVGENGTILQSDPMSGDCTATLSLESSIHVPIIDTDGSYVSADLLYKGNTSEAIFRVTNVHMVTNPGGYGKCKVASLSFDGSYKLDVPAITFNNLSYQARFEHTPSSDSQVWFKLISAARN